MQFLSLLVLINALKYHGFVLIYRTLEIIQKNNIECKTQLLDILDLPSVLLCVHVDCIGMLLKT
jgi:hypothetical protein